MLFWFLVAILTLTASLAVMWPFLGRERQGVGGIEHDLAVYRDQLAELEREAQRGLISGGDAAEARAEIGRRILKCEEARSATAEGGKRAGTTTAIIAAMAVLAVPAVSWGLYALLGSPGMPALPLQARMQGDPAQASIEELVARAESYLSANPQDARGWETLAPIYARMGRYDDAASAYSRTIALAGSTADREAALGESLVGRAGGIVTADAEAAFARALEHDAENPRARFFIAMGRAQEGKTDEARAMWQEMAADLPSESPWQGAVRQAVASLGAGGQEAAGPTREDMAEAEEMAPQDRQAMIEGMVAGLDARLRENPNDVAGWRRLMRSYVVLGEQEKAVDALARAHAALGVDSDEGQALVEFARTLGLSPEMK